MEPTVNVLIVISLFELAVISLFTDGGRQSQCPLASTYFRAGGKTLSSRVQLKLAVMD
jgi:hypothetical protein